MKQEEGHWRGRLLPVLWLFLIRIFLKSCCFHLMIQKNFHLLREKNFIIYCMNSKNWEIYSSALGKPLLKKLMILIFYRRLFLL